MSGWACGAVWPVGPACLGTPGVHDWWQALHPAHTWHHSRLLQSLQLNHCHLHGTWPWKRTSVIQIEELQNICLTGYEHCYFLKTYWTWLMGFELAYVHSWWHFGSIFGQGASKLHPTKIASQIWFSTLAFCGSVWIKDGKVLGELLSGEFVVLSWLFAKHRELAHMLINHSHMLSTKQMHCKRTHEIRNFVHKINCTLVGHYEIFSPVIFQYNWYQTDVI